LPAAAGASAAAGLRLSAAQDFPKKLEPREVSNDRASPACGLSGRRVRARRRLGAGRDEDEWVEYGHGDTKLKAYMAYDDKGTGRRPAVLMIHAREGMTPKTQRLAETWAKLGYTFAPDISGR
jgi:hypothetical protein